jgi:hypothetical protein
MLVGNEYAVMMNQPTDVNKVLVEICLIVGNPENQKYFGCRKNSQGVQIFAELMDQLEDPLGPAVTLSQLLSANDDLMKKYAKVDLVNKFVDMVRSFGPQSVRKYVSDALLLTCVDTYNINLAICELFRGHLRRKWHGY